MAKIMVIQHVPYEPLGTLDPLIRQQKHRIRYVNFARHPDANPDLEDYAALIVLGGPMNVDEQQKYPFLKTELEIIRKAMKLNIPILGICLGSQLIAHALGARVYQAPTKELGWFSLTPTAEAVEDPLMQHWRAQEQIFQWHGHTFDMPTGAVPLVAGEPIKNQGFRYGQNIYGFQFHLEITQDLIDRWLHLNIYLDEFPGDTEAHVKKIIADSKDHIDNSINLSQKVFLEFLKLIPTVDRHIVLRSR